MNADDWGRDRATTASIFECTAAGAVSSVSAMVFMEDSDRAAAIAQQHGIDAGLHLNLTTNFSAPRHRRRLAERHQAIARHLHRHRFAPLLFHPGLVRSFEYVVGAQIDEFRRLYGRDPLRIDGHHHMHLCANVILQDLLPAGALVRRNFSFQPGEKSLCNRLYRRMADAVLARRYHLVDFFFSLPPFDPPRRLSRIFALARHAIVEVETHPGRPEERDFLVSGELFRRARFTRIGPPPLMSRYGLHDKGATP
jgi:hypothetical protein